jgi:hypothetical protein
LFWREWNFKHGSAPFIVATKKYDNLLVVVVELYLR